MDCVPFLVTADVHLGGSVAAFVSSNIRGQTWAWGLLVEDSQDGGPTGCLCVFQRESTYAYDIQTAKPINELGMYDRANGGWLRKPMPCFLGLVLDPSPQVLCRSGSTIRVQLILYGTCLGD